MAILILIHFDSIPISILIMVANQTFLKNYARDLHVPHNFLLAAAMTLDSFISNTKLHVVANFVSVWPVMD